MSSVKIHNDENVGLRARSITANALWSVIGQVSPMLLGIVVIPRLLHALGTDKFGLLTLAWVVTGYFSFFDLGIGRALTKLVAEGLHDRNGRDVGLTVGTGLVLMLVTGLIGASLLGTFATSIVSLLHIDPVSRPEVTRALIALALSIPIVITTSAMRAVLEGFQRFKWTNLVRIFMGVQTFLGPLIAVYYSRRIDVIVYVLLANRALAWLIHVALCLRIETLRSSISVDVRRVGALVSYGGWVTVSNVVGPLMNYCDRFLITSLMSVSALAFYATPYEVITKVFIVPVAVDAALFPAFASVMAALQPQAVDRLFDDGIRLVFLATLPVCFIGTTFAREILTLWLGADFAAHSSMVLAILASGVLINSLAHVPFTLLQGIGFAKWTAKLHIIQFPLMLLGVWFAVSSYGIVGAAGVWLLRASVEAIVLLYLVWRKIPSLRHYTQNLAAGLAVTLGVFVAAAQVRAILPRALVAFAIASMSAVLLWNHIRSRMSVDAMTYELSIPEPVGSEAEMDLR